MKNCDRVWIDLYEDQHPRQIVLIDVSSLAIRRITQGLEDVIFECDPLSDDFSTWKKIILSKIMIDK